MNKRVACIIKGNPERMIGNEELAKNYYNDIKEYLEYHGFIVIFDEGLPHTCPPVDDVSIWIGHSRGVGRIICLQDDKKELFGKLGDLDGGINSEDKIWMLKMNKYFDKGIQPPKEEQPPKDHFEFSREHKEEVDRVISNFRDKLTLEQLLRLI